MSGWESGVDLVVVGSGVAGLTAALDAAAAGLSVVVVTKDALDAGSTRWAQGGVAVVLDEHSTTDTVAAHAADTVAAGGGLCDIDVVADLLAAGPAAVRRLISRGAVFDTGPDSRLTRTREGGHGARRVVHAGGDATGAEITRALVSATAGARLVVLVGHTATDVLRTPDGAVAGLAVLDDRGVPGRLRAPAVVLATGGYGHLYTATTNPATATGDGVAVGLRAGAVAADLEFVQFHPTVLMAGPTTGRRPLLTEALRGEGAVLRDRTGARFLLGVHPGAELAPRDVVAAAIAARMAATGTDHVLLDATGVPDLATRFPTVRAACRAAGFDPVREPVPVAPAAHYACGGIRTDTHGRTGVPGLYAAGEVARTGLHGANRLASNSLVEGLVVGERVAAAVLTDRPARIAGDALLAASPAVPIAPRAVLQRAMSAAAGIGRDAAGLACASDVLDAATVLAVPADRTGVEDAALTLLAQAVLAAAGTRTETRGCHVRTDFPDRDDRWQAAPLLVRWTGDGLRVGSDGAVVGGVAR